MFCEWTFFGSVKYEKQKINMSKHYFLYNVICERIFFCTRMHEKPYIYKCEDNLLYACANLFAPLDVSGHIYAYHIHVYNMLDDE